MEKKQYCKKVSFGNEQQALFYIDKLQKTSVRESVPQRAYLCHHCNNWHLTSRPNKTELYQRNEIKELKEQVNELKLEIVGYKKIIGNKNTTTFKIKSEKPISY